VAVRTNWFARFDVPAGDPFDEPAVAEAAIEKVGTPIAVDGEFAELEERLVNLLDAETDLFNAGVTCDIRDRADTSCHACPVRDCGELCEVGCDMETVVTLLAVKRRGV